jgi:cytochrome b561
MTTSAVRYTRTAVVLHWIIAILIGTMIVIGLFMTDLPRHTPERGWYFNLHKSLGLLTAGVILLRVFWRLRFSPPRLEGSTPSWQAAMAKTSHMALYACMMFMPLTGYLGSVFNKFGIRFFGLPLPNWAWDDPKLREIFVTAHHWIADVLIGLIALHVVAALYHALQRDGVFTRMWFAGAR